MINADSLAVVGASKLTPEFSKPLYDSYSFARIPQTIIHLLTGSGDAGLPDSVLAGLPPRYQKVVLLLVDAFGWRFFEQFAEQYPFLKRFIQAGTASKLTTQFPSTTAAHVTTIHTGLPVNVSGVYEWLYLEPKLNRVIAPLLFSFAPDTQRDTLKGMIEPDQIFPQSPTLYQQLKAHDVQSHLFMNREYASSPYTQAVTRGATIYAYRTISEALVNLGQAIITQAQPAYFFFYFEGIDTIGHRYGPGSAQFAAEVDTFFTALERLLFPTVTGRVQDSLLLVTADHGQMEVSPDTTVYLNQRIPSLQGFMKTGADGLPLTPAGSPRDMFLYIHDEQVAEAQDLLARELEGIAAVYRTDDLIAAGVFGSGEPSAVFLERLGNLVVLPYARQSVWWYEKDRFAHNFYGHHGGLSPQEIETILLAYPL